MSQFYLSETTFTTPGSLHELLWNSIRSGLTFNKYAGRTKFSAVVLTPPIPLTDLMIKPFYNVSDKNWTDTTSSPYKFVFKARIIGQDSPHDHLPDPCELPLAVNAPAALEQIALHTTFISSDKHSFGDRPKMNDIVLVEMFPGAGRSGYNLQHGQYVGVSDSVSTRAKDKNSAVPACGSLKTILEKGKGLNVKTLSFYTSIGGKYKAGETRKIDFTTIQHHTPAGEPGCTPANLNATSVEEYLGPAGWKAFKGSISKLEGKPTSHNDDGYIGMYQFGLAALASSGAIDKGKTIAAIKKKIRAKYPTIADMTDKDVEREASYCFAKQQRAAPGNKGPQYGKGAKSRCLPFTGRDSGILDTPGIWKNIPIYHSPGTTGTKKDGTVSAYYRPKNAADFKSSRVAQEALFDPFISGKFKELKAMGALPDLSNTADVVGMLASSHLKGAGGASSMRNGLDNADANGTPASKYYIGVGLKFIEKCKAP